MGSFGGSAPQQDQYAANKYAKINRQLWEDYKKRYKPVETRLMGDIQNEGQQRADNIGRTDQLTDTAFRNSEQAGLRRSSRYGGMTAEQRAAFDRKINLEHASATAGNENTVRQQTNDRLLGVEGGMINVGRGQRGRAVGGFGKAAQLEAQRNATNAGLAAQNQAGQMQLAGTVAGVGVAAAVF